MGHSHESVPDIAHWKDREMPAQDLGASTVVPHRDDSRHRLHVMRQLEIDVPDACTAREDHYVDGRQLASNWFAVPAVGGSWSDGSGLCGARRREAWAVGG